jgi:hypothetical protein
VRLEAATLEIVWRNPQAVRRPQRWEAVVAGFSSSLYIVQEFLSTGDHGFWNTTCGLEVFPGSRIRGRIAAGRPGE